MVLNSIAAERFGALDLDPKDQPVVARLQYWLDLFDTAARDSTWAKTTIGTRDKKTAPSPVATPGGVGWYTFEQQADEIGLELLQKAGLDPQSLLNMLTKLLRNNAGPNLADQDAAIAQCVTHGIPFNPATKQFEYKGGNLHSALEQDFSLSAWTEPHHSSSYRIYNVMREIWDHHYKSAQKITFPASLPQDKTWKELVSNVPDFIEAAYSATGASLSNLATKKPIISGARQKLRPLCTSFLPK